MDREFTTVNELEAMLHTLAPLLSKRRDDGELSKEEWKNLRNTVTSLEQEAMDATYPTTFSQFLDQHVLDPNLREKIASLATMGNRSPKTKVIVTGFQYASAFLENPALVDLTNSPMPEDVSKFLKVTENISKHTRGYKILPVIQSTGMGKSFLIARVAKVRPVLYLSFADASHFPPISSYASTFMTQSPVESLKCLVQAAILYFTERRSKCLGLPKCTIQESEWKPSSSDCFEYYLAQLSIENSKSNRYYIRKAEANKQLGNRDLNSIVRDFNKLVGESHTIFVIDECKSVVHHQSQPDLYDVSLTKGLVLVLMDTSGTLTDMNPGPDAITRQNNYYARLPIRGGSWQRPNVILTDVCYPYPIFTSPYGSEVTVQEIPTLASLSKYGRPLWGSLYRAAGDLGTPFADEDILRLVLSKLTNTNLSPQFLRDENFHPAMLSVDMSHIAVACLATTAGVEFHATHTDNEILQSNHLASFICTDMGKRASYIRYFPEPWVAFAAGHLLRKPEFFHAAVETYRTVFAHRIQLFVRNIDQARGGVGEIVGRLAMVHRIPSFEISSGAKDSTKTSTLEALDNRIMYSVHDFFTLLIPHFGDLIQDLATTQRSWLVENFCTFRYFAVGPPHMVPQEARRWTPSLGSLINKSISSKMLVNAWYRCAALCANDESFPNQPAIDCIFSCRPLGDSDDQNVEENKFSDILVQIKNKRWGGKKFQGEADPSCIGKMRFSLPVPFTCYATQKDGGKVRFSSDKPNVIVTDSLVYDLTMILHKMVVWYYSAEYSEYRRPPIILVENVNFQRDAVIRISLTSKSLDWDKAKEPNDDEQPSVDDSEDKAIHAIKDRWKKSELSSVGVFPVPLECFVFNPLYSCAARDGLMKLKDTTFSILEVVRNQYPTCVPSVQTILYPNKSDQKGSFTNLFG